MDLQSVTTKELKRMRKNLIRDRDMLREVAKVAEPTSLMFTDYAESFTDMISLLDEVIRLRKTVKRVRKFAQAESDGWGGKAVTDYHAARLDMAESVLFLIAGDD